MEEMGALALASRLKRLSDSLMQDGVRIYQAADLGFEPRWFPVFAFLFRKGPTSITELARGLGVSHPGINKIANELIAVKLVAPYRDRNDKRKRVLALTSLGRHKYKGLEPTWRGIRQALQSAVDEGGGDFLQSLSMLESSFGDKDFFHRYAEQAAKPESGVVIERYKPEYATMFEVLNKRWIEHYFTLEQADRQILENPEESILSRGGDILFALDADSSEVIGTCALLKLSEQQAELAKMAVAEEAKGRQIGLLLGEAVIDHARKSGFSTLCLESNRKLNPAISLYRKLGFIEQPFPHPSDYSRADIYMALEL